MLRQQHQLILTAVTGACVEIDPLDADSDDDSFTDLEEVLYGGNPNECP